MPTIETVVGMHNEVPEANTDKVWAGMVVRLDDGRYQFVSLYGPRYGTIRPSPQPASASRFRAQQKYDQMYREKLAHGYHVIDWRNHRYSLYSAIGRLGDLSGVRGPLPVGASETPAAERDPMPRPRPAYTSPAVERVESSGAIADAMRREAARREAEHVPEPSVEALTEYIASRTSSEPPPTPKPADQPRLRKARRVDF